MNLVEEYIWIYPPPHPVTGLGWDSLLKNVS